MPEPSTGKKLVTSKANLVAFIRRYAIMVSVHLLLRGIVRGLPWRTSVAALAVWLFLSSVFLTATAESPRPLPVLPPLCVSAEDCFRSALAVNDRTGSPAQREQATALKIDQLRSVMDLFPSTPWAQRARVVLGILLIDREPAEATKFLRAAQPELPVIDDYFRVKLLGLVDAELQVVPHIERTARGKRRLAATLKGLRLSRPSWRVALRKVAILYIILQ